MPIDTSIYRSQPNAIQQFGQLAGTMNALMQNRIMQEQLRTNLATSDAVKQATNPATGQFDPQRAVAVMSQGPAAYNLPQFMQQMTQQQQAQVGLDTSKFELANKQLGAVRTALSSVLANPQASPKDYVAALTQLVSQGIATPKMAADVISSMPQDPAKLKAWGTEHLVNTMSAQERLNSIYGTPQMQQGVDAQGRPMQVPIAVSPIAGVNMLPVNAGGAAAPGPAAAGGGQQPGGLPVARTQTGAQGLVTGLAPGQAKSLENSTQAWNDLQKDVGGSAQRVFQLNEALKGLQGTNTGPGTEWRNNMISYAQALGMPIGDPKDVANYDKAMKYLTQNATSMAGAMGSDAKLASALSGNASTKISNLAAQDVVKANIALERIKQAQAEVFQKTGALPGEFADWAVQWSKNVDPRAFALDMMAPKDRKTLVEGLKGNEQRRFLDSVKLAIMSGLVDPASFQQAQTAAK